MKKHICSECPLRAKYDKSPKSFLGRLWRAHINICPGWKGYFKAQSQDVQEVLRQRYRLNGSK